MKLSDFGKQMSSDAGILALMDDLGKALAGDTPIAMFGGGNPAVLSARFCRHLCRNTSAIVIS